MIKSLEMRGYLQKVDGEYLISQKLRDVVDNFSEDEWITSDYREKFSNANIGEPGKMGTESVVVAKMQRFMLTYPEITKQEILDATDAYIQHTSDKKYLKQADYFIFKREGSATEESSVLLTWVEIIRETSNRSSGPKIV
jgi:hypothetical protein